MPSTSTPLSAEVRAAEDAKYIINHFYNWRSKESWQNYNPPSNFKLLKEIKNIDKDIEKIATKSISEHGTGGMKTKIDAAKICQLSGCQMAIANGLLMRPIKKIIKDKISVLSINQKDPTSNPVPYTVDYDWEIVEDYRDTEGYVNSKKVQVSFFDEDDDGVVDDPDLFDVIVNETNNPLRKYIFSEKITSIDGVEEWFYKPNSVLDIITLQNKASLGSTTLYTDGQIFYYVDENIFEILDKTTSNLNISQKYRAQIGRDNIKFHYVHAADESTRIDPSVSNIVDTYLLTRSYDNSFRQYLDNIVTTKPLAPSSDSLFLNYGATLNNIKSLSDEIIYHPVKYKILFGTKANAEFQADFKIVKNPDIVVNDNEVKSRVISAINEFFALDNWDFGETFYFTELTAYVMQQLAPAIVTFVIVPKQKDQTFGSLFEIKSEPDEIFISGASVDDVQVIDAITASRIQATGNVVTASSTATTSGITSGTTYSSSSY